jgi:GT2 family glycosyltransferase
MRDVMQRATGKTISPVPVMSGSCMLLRRKAIDATGGFDPTFFLYFEDFDWSVRLNRVTQSAYVPSVRVVHHGGGAARKHWRHTAYFGRSAVRRFNKNRWRWWRSRQQPSLLIRRVLVTGADGFIGGRCVRD